jgi:hypothetical protein
MNEEYATPAFAHAFLRGAFGSSKLHVVAAALAFAVRTRFAKERTTKLIERRNQTSWGHFDPALRLAKVVGNSSSIAFTASAATVIPVKSRDKPTKLSA